MCIAWQDILEHLFLDSEVDMVMSGHVHLYARTCSVKRDRCKKENRGGITHVTVGAAPLSRRPVRLRKVTKPAVSSCQVLPPLQHEGSLVFVALA